MIPDLAVIESTADTLQGPASGSKCAKDASYQVTLGEHLNSLDETSGTGAGDADNHVDTEEEVETTKEKVHVIVQCLFLHVTIVDRSVPQKEGEGWDYEQVANASTEVFSSVTRAGNEDEYTGKHVYKEGSEKDEP